MVENQEESVHALNRGYALIKQMCLTTSRYGIPLFSHGEERTLLLVCLTLSHKHFCFTPGSHLGQLGDNVLQLIKNYSNNAIMDHIVLEITILTVFHQVV